MTTKELEAFITASPNADFAIDHLPADFVRKVYFMFHSQFKNQDGQDPVAHCEHQGMMDLIKLHPHYMHDEKLRGQYASLMTTSVFDLVSYSFFTLMHQLIVNT